MCQRRCLPLLSALTRLSVKHPFVPHQRSGTSLAPELGPAHRMCGTEMVYRMEHCVPGTNEKGAEASPSLTWWPPHTSSPRRATGPTSHCRHASSLLVPKTPPPFSPAGLHGPFAQDFSSKLWPSAQEPADVGFLLPAAAGTPTQAGCFSPNIISSARSRTSPVFMLTLSFHRRRRRKDM